MSCWVVASVALALVAMVGAQRNQEPFEVVVVQYQPPKNSADQEYYMSRVRETVELAEAQGRGNVVLLNTGGAELTETAAAAYSAVSPTATALSLGDFDNGLSGTDGLFSRLKASGENFVAANLNSTRLGGLVSKSVVKRFRHRSVGVIGFVSPYLRVLLSGDQDSHIGSEVAAVRKEVARLQRQGTNIIIAMGNAGHEANMELARIVPGVDVVVAAPTDVPGAEFPQMVSKQSSRDIPMLEIPTVAGNTIGVTRLLFNARGEMKRGVGLYAAVKENEDETDTLHEEITQILRLQPEQNEVTGHSVADNKIESEAPTTAADPAPVPAPAPAPFRPRPAMSTATGEVLAAAAGKISGLASDCKTKECDMGKVIADAVRWRLGGRINAAVVGDGVFSGSWEGEIRESDVDSSLLDDLTVYMGRLRGTAQLKQLFMQATLSNTEFLHASGVTMTVDPATHAVSKMMIDCSTCVPGGLRKTHEDMPYTISFVTGANTKPSIFMDVRDTGLKLKKDVVIPYLRRNKNLQVPSEGRISMTPTTTDTDSRVSQVLSEAEAPAAAASTTPVRAPVQAPVRVAVQTPSQQPAVSQVPMHVMPHGKPLSVAQSMLHHLPPPPSGNEQDTLAHQQATAAYQQAVLAAVQQAAAGQSDQHYTSEQQLALTELYNSLSGRPTANGVLVQQPVLTVAGPGGVPAALLAANGQDYARPEAGAGGSDSQLPALLQAITGHQTQQQQQQAGTDGVSSLLPSWLTASSDTDSAAADGTAAGGLASYLPGWASDDSDQQPAAATAAQTVALPGAATDSPEESGTSVAGQALRAAVIIPAMFAAVSFTLGTVL